MHEFRLSGWPSLPSSFDRLGFSRALSQLSHRYLTVDELVRASGLSRGQVEDLLEQLEAQACVVVRPVPGVAGRGPLSRVASALARSLGVFPSWRGRGTVTRMRIDPRL
jgi:hypothetical protein